jgi:hypothetical protein
LRLTPQPLGSADLLAYQRSFLARYGHQGEVPLLEMIDPDNGIGPMGHLHGAGTGISQQHAASRGRALMDLALGALRDGRRVVELDSTIVKVLQTWEPSLATAPGERLPARAWIA